MVAPYVASLIETASAEVYSPAGIEKVGVAAVVGAIPVPLSASV
jgi:hypothetical protein